MQKRKKRFQESLSQSTNEYLKLLKLSYLKPLQLIEFVLDFYLSRKNLVDQNFTRINFYLILNCLLFLITDSLTKSIYFSSVHLFIPSFIGSLLLLPITIASFYLLVLFSYLINYALGGKASFKKTVIVFFSSTIILTIEAIPYLRVLIFILSIGTLVYLLKRVNKYSYLASIFNISFLLMISIFMLYQLGIVTLDTLYKID